jgi:hypothetical protein
MKNSQNLLAGYQDEIDKLTSLVQANGLNCQETIKQSQRLDELILTMQFTKKGEMQNEKT